MFIDVTIIAILLSLLCGGNPLKTVQYPYRFLYLFPIPFALQLLGFLGHDASVFLNPISYVMVILLMFFNLHIPGVIYMMVGTAANLVAVIIGKGKMPVVKNVAAYIGIHSVGAKHVFVESPKETFFLGDITIIYFPWRRSFVVSIGDLIIALGLMIFFLSSLKQQKKRELLS